MRSQSHSSNIHPFPFSGYSSGQASSTDSILQVLFVFAAIVIALALIILVLYSILYLSGVVIDKLYKRRDGIVTVLRIVLKISGISFIIYMVLPVFFLVSGFVENFAGISSFTESTLISALMGIIVSILVIGIRYFYQRKNRVLESFTSTIITHKWLEPDKIKVISAIPVSLLVGIGIGIFLERVGVNNPFNNFNITSTETPVNFLFSAIGGTGPPPDDYFSLSFLFTLIAILSIIFSLTLLSSVIGGSINAVCKIVSTWISIKAIAAVSFFGGIKSGSKELAIVFLSPLIEREDKLLDDLAEEILSDFVKQRNFFYAIYLDKRI